MRLAPGASFAPACASPTPASLTHAPRAPLEVVEQAAFADRWFHLRTTHPIELSGPLGGTTATYQKAWIDWNVKLRHSSVDGYDEGAMGSYAYDRGFPHGTGLNLVE